MDIGILDNIIELLNKYIKIVDETYNYLTIDMDGTIHKIAQTNIPKKEKLKLIEEYILNEKNSIYINFGNKIEEIFCIESEIMSYIKILSSEKYKSNSLIINRTSHYFPEKIEETLKNISNDITTFISVIGVNLEGKEEFLEDLKKGKEISSREIMRILLIKYKTLYKEITDAMKKNKDSLYKFRSEVINQKFSNINLINYNKLA